MLDSVNRIRNLSGNYRYVSYLMRYWKIVDRLGFSSDRIERRMIAQALHHYSSARPWSSVDLGCGGRPLNLFDADDVAGCDLKANPDTNVMACNLSTDPIPFESNILDFVIAQNFVEHVPRILPASSGTRFPFVELMTEIYRVLKPDGLFFSKTPAYPRLEAFQDPTHVNIITNDTFPYYFCWHPFGGPWGRLYGFTGRFDLVQQRWQGPHLLTLLRKL